MTANQKLRELTLRFTGTDDADDAIPLGSMASTLLEFSKFVQLTAHYVFRRERAALPGFDRSIYSVNSLTCHVPRAGCLELPVTFGPDPGSIESERVRRFTNQFYPCVHDVLRATGNHDEHRFKEIVPECRVREKMLHALDRLDSKQGSGVQFQALDYRNRVLYSSKRKSPYTRTGLPACQESEILDATGIRRYSGRLHTVGIGSPYLNVDLLQGKTLKVPYDKLSSHRKFLQLGLPTDDSVLVTVVGETKHAKLHSRVIHMARVEDIVTVNEIEAEREVFSVDGQLFKASPPVRFRVLYDLSDKLYVVEGEFGLEIALESASDIRSAIDEVLAFRWESIGQSDGPMTERAGAIRTEMRSRITEYRG